MELDKIIEKWDEIIDIVLKETESSEVAYKTFLAPLEVYDIIDDTIYIIYSEDSERRMIQHIEKKYKVLLRNAISQYIDNKYDLKIILPNEALKIGSDNSEKVEISLNNNNTDYINSNNYMDSNLNPKYTFNTFVVGRNNKFAQGTAYAVADAPGEICNPLFICGGPGLGKTHLMHAIGNQIIENNNSKRVIYVTAEEFTNEVIECIYGRNKSSQNDMSQFRDKYRNADVLMIDDIQFFVDKDTSQQEFFNTFNKLHNSGKQIVISSDKMPNEIEGFDDRYITRFEQGITAEIKIPDYETRVAIIKNKIENKNLIFTDDVIDYIATNITSNIRSIEGAINRLIAYSNLENTDINIDNTKTILESIISPDKPKEITPQLIMEVVCEHYGVTIDNILSKSRTNDLVRPRHVIMWLCTHETDCSQESIAKLLGRENHTTVIHGKKKIDEQLKTDNELKNQIETIKKKIYSN